MTARRYFKEKRKALKYECLSRDDRVTVTLLTAKRTATKGEAVLKRNNKSLLNTCVPIDVTKSIPLERIDDRTDLKQTQRASFWCIIVVYSLSN